MEDAINPSIRPHKERQTSNIANKNIKHLASTASNCFNFFSQLLSLNFKSNNRIQKPSNKIENILIIAPDSKLPSAHICLAIPLIESNTMNVIVHDEKSLADHYGHDSVDNALKRCIHKNSIEAVVLCRFFGSTVILDTLKAHGIPSIYFIDDDLLNPCEISIGSRKVKIHGSKIRLKSVRYFLERVDYIYASTCNLKKQLLKEGIPNNIATSRINCSPISCPAAIPKRHTHAENQTVEKIGYMGFGHKSDFEIVALPIEKLLDNNSDLHLELIGSIEIPKNLLKHQSRIFVHPPIFNYRNFINFLRSRNWSVGICPLVKTSFNDCKSINKWVEYASSQIPVVASRGVIYDECIGNDAGILCDSTFEDWYEGLEKIIYDKPFAKTIADAAFLKVNTLYSQADHAIEIKNILEKSTTSNSPAIPQ